MVPNEKTDVLQGTLDLMVLKTLDSLGPQHGYGIAQRLQQISNELLRLNQGTLYPALLDFVEMGHVREQPQGEVLQPHARGAEATAARGGRLATDGRHHGARPRRRG